MDQQANTTNATSPFDIAATASKSRQVLRAENRQAAKDFRRHTNEVRLGKNRSRMNSPLPLNRAGRRKFASNTCPPAFRKAVIEHMAGTAA